MKGTSSSEISRDVVWSCYVLEFLQENEESPWIPQQVVRFHSKRHAMALTARNHLASEIPHQAMLCFELLSIGRAQMQNMKSDVRNMTMWIAKDGKNRKNHSCRINDIITHATCAVFVAFWFPWLQMTKPALSPRIWSNYTVYAREILHTHSWYNINYASIILRGSFALLDMLRAAIWSLCFIISLFLFRNFSLFPSLWLPLFAPSRRQRCPLLGLWKETTQLQTFWPQHRKPCFRVPCRWALYCTYFMASHGSNNSNCMLRWILRPCQVYGMIIECWNFGLRCHWVPPSSEKHSVRPPV